MMGRKVLDEKFRIKIKEKNEAVCFFLMAENACKDI